MLLISTVVLQRVQVMLPLRWSILSQGYWGVRKGIAITGDAGRELGLGGRLLEAGRLVFPAPVPRSESVVLLGARRVRADASGFFGVERALDGFDGREARGHAFLGHLELLVSEDVLADLDGRGRAVPCAGARGGWQVLKSPVRVARRRRTPLSGCQAFTQDLSVFVA